VTVLLVDNDLIYAKITAKMLRHSGWRVLTAETYQSAIITYQEYSGDISAVILDVCLPNSHGTVILEEFRHCRKQLPCLFVSGYLLDKTTLDCLNNITGFVQKPHSQRELEQKLQDVINGAAKLPNDGGLLMTADKFPESMKGTTEQRPDAVDAWFGPWFDLTLQKPIWWNGSAWVDASGNIV